MSTTDTPAEIGLQTLLDERAILQVVTRYARALDTKDFALLDDVFTPDATGDLASPTTLVGVDAIRARIRMALDHLDESQHLVGNHEIEVDGDTATHRCYLQAQHVRHAAEGGTNYIVAGRYEDQFVRTDVGWRIKHRRLVVMWMDGNPTVVHVART